MDKKGSKEDSEQKRELEEESLIEESGGFPEDIDFKKFLGCGG